MNSAGVRGNAPPIASFAFEPEVPQVNQSVTFDGRGSTGGVVNFAYTSDGLYDVRLEVEDGEGATAQLTRTLQVIDPPTTFVLDVLRAGNGAGVVQSVPQGINCGTDCTEAFEELTVVLLTASASPGSQFGGWSNCPDEVPQAGVPPRCRVTMTAARTVTATFTASGPGTNLTLNIQGPGFGVVTYTPNTTACSKDAATTQCVRSFALGTQVVLRALAYTGSRIGEWGGCDTLSADSVECTVTMTVDRRVDLFLIN